MGWQRWSRSREKMESQGTGDKEERAAKVGALEEGGEEFRWQKGSGLGGRQVGISGSPRAQDGTREVQDIRQGTDVCVEV